MIYFIQEGEDGPIKIGRIKDSVPNLDDPWAGNHIKNRLEQFEAVRKRLKLFQCGNSRPLKILKAIQENKLEFREADLHKYFEDINIHGEWFFPTKDLLDFIEDL